MKKPNLKVLKAVRELLSDPSRWYKGAWTNNNDYGMLAELASKKDDPSCQFCLLGAFYACSDLADEVEGLYRSFDIMANEILAPCLPDWAGRDNLGGPWTPTFNDDPNTTHEDVLKVLDCAIARAEGPIS